MHANSPGTHIGADYATDAEIEFGFDYNGDGKLQGEEVAAKDPHQFKIVDQYQYDQAVSALGRTYTGGSLVGCPHAANFVYCFVTNQGLSGATNVSTTIASSDVRLDHHVGANFVNVQGNAKKAVFASNSTSALPQDIVASPQMDALIWNTFDANYEDLRAHAPAVGADSDWVGGYTLLESDGKAANSINFTGLSDLHYALGHAGLSGMTVYFKMHRELHHVVGPEDDYSDLQLTQIKVVGTLSDIIDYRYGGSDAFATPAAAVQAGYPTLGNAGHIYEVEVNMNNIIAANWSLGSLRA